MRGNRKLPSLICLVALILVIISSGRITKDDVEWELEGYNNWNLPFSKKVVLQPRGGGDNDINFSSGRYKLEVDPTAYFTVLFLSSFEDDYKEEDARTLNYTFYGSTTMQTYKGNWVDCTMSIDKKTQQESETTHDYDIDITIFIVPQDPPEAGLKGILGLAPAPSSVGLNSVSLMY